MTLLDASLLPASSFWKAVFADLESCKITSILPIEALLNCHTQVDHPAVPESCAVDYRTQPALPTDPGYFFKSKKNGLSGSGRCCQLLAYDELLGVVLGFEYTDVEVAD